MPVQNIGGPNLQPKDVNQPISNVSSWARKREQKQREEKQNGLSSEYLNAVMSKLSPQPSSKSSPKSSPASSLASLSSLLSSPTSPKSPKGTQIQIESGPGFSASSRRRRSPARGRQEREIIDARNTAALARAMHGEMREKAQKGNLTNPTPPTSSRRSTSFTRRRHKNARIDHIEESLRDKDKRGGRIKKTKKMKKRRKTKRKHHKKKDKKYKGGTPPGQTPLTSELPFWKNWL